MPPSQSRYRCISCCVRQLSLLHLDKLQATALAKLSCVVVAATVESPLRNAVHRSPCLLLSTPSIWTVCGPSHCIFYLKLKPGRFGAAHRFCSENRLDEKDVRPATRFIPLRLHFPEEHKSSRGAPTPHPPQGSAAGFDSGKTAYCTCIRTAPCARLVSRACGEETKCRGAGLGTLGAGHARDRYAYAQSISALTVRQQHPSVDLPHRSGLGLRMMTTTWTAGLAHGSQSGRHDSIYPSNATRGGISSIV